jgi:hypothetical protein
MQNDEPSMYHRVPVSSRCVNLIVQRPIDRPRQKLFQGRITTDNSAVACQTMIMTASVSAPQTKTGDGRLCMPGLLLAPPPWEPYGTGGARHISDVRIGGLSLLRLHFRGWQRVAGIPPGTVLLHRTSPPVMLVKSPSVPWPRPLA